MPTNNKTKPETKHTKGPRTIETHPGYHQCASCGVDTGGNERHSAMCLYFPPTTQLNMARKTADALTQEAADYAESNPDMMAVKMEAAAAWRETIYAWNAYEEMRKAALVSEAAPEMLAALKAVEAMTGIEREYGGKADELVRAAIQKAEGR